MSKAYLATNPIVFIIPKSQQRLEVSFDLRNDRLTVKFEGLKSSKFPKIVKKNRASYHKIENVAKG